MEMEKSPSMKLCPRHLMTYVPSSKPHQNKQNAIKFVLKLSLEDVEWNMVKKLPSHNSSMDGNNWRLQNSRNGQETNLLSFVNGEMLSLIFSTKMEVVQSLWTNGKLMEKSLVSLHHKKIVKRHFDIAIWTTVVTLMLTR
uniref:Apoobelin mRNA n=1 Tax=Obelia longissima TaxID=32570 RepID=A2NDK4_OBELO|nr:ORF1 [Obelia longissima]